MADLINLRQARKRRDRDDKARAAEENRIRFGRTKAQKMQDRAMRRKAERDHESHRLERDDEA